MFSALFKCLRLNRKWGNVGSGWEKQRVFMWLVYRVIIVSASWISPPPNHYLEGFVMAWKNYSASSLFLPGTQERVHWLFFVLSSHQPCMIAWTECWWLAKAAQGAPWPSRDCNLFSFKQCSLCCSHSLQKPFVKCNEEIKYCRRLKFRLRTVLFSSSSLPPSFLNHELCWI